MIEEDCFICHSDWDKILGHVIHCLCAIYTLINLAKVPDRILFCNDLLSNSSATPTKCWWIVVKNIFWYLNSTSDLGVCKCNQALIMGFGDNDHMIKGLMSFIEMISRYNKNDDNTCDGGASNYKKTRWWTQRLFNSLIFDLEFRICHTIKRDTNLGGLRKIEWSRI
jgi:hypothetical protein